MMEPLQDPWGEAVAELDRKKARRQQQMDETRQLRARLRAEQERELAAQEDLEQQRHQARQGTATWTEADRQYDGVHPCVPGG